MSLSAHLAEDYFLLEEQTTQKILYYAVPGTEGSRISKRDRIYSQAELE
jgi:hypothetical protein